MGWATEKFEFRHAQVTSSSPDRNVGPIQFPAESIRGRGMGTPVLNGKMGWTPIRHSCQK